MAAPRVLYISQNFPWRERIGTWCDDTRMQVHGSPWITCLHWSWLRHLFSMVLCSLDLALSGDPGASGWISWTKVNRHCFNLAPNQDKTCGTLGTQSCCECLSHCFSKPLPFYKVPWSSTLEKDCMSKHLLN